MATENGEINKHRSIIFWSCWDDGLQKILQSPKYFTTEAAEEDGAEEGILKTMLADKLL